MIIEDLNVAVRQLLIGDWDLRKMLGVFVISMLRYPIRIFLDIFHMKKPSFMTFLTRKIDMIAKSNSELCVDCSELATVWRVYKIYDCIMPLCRYHSGPDSIHIIDFSSRDDAIVYSVLGS